MHLNFLSLNLSEFEQVYQYCHKLKDFEKFKSNFNQKCLANLYNVLQSVQILNVDTKNEIHKFEKLQKNIFNMRSNATINHHKCKISAMMIVLFGLYKNTSAQDLHCFGNH